MKTGNSFQIIAAASLKEYVTGLQESGIDGIPLAMFGNTSTGQEHPEFTVPSLVPAIQTGTQKEPLDKIRKDLGDCQRCKLGKTRKNLVFGVGSPEARLVFVGEGPGADEDLAGEPFVGEAGQILNRIITAMELKREDVYICNVVKCRPPRNRDPGDDEVAACSPFLLRQIQSIRPEVIVSLGKYASHTLLGTKEAISRLRGKFRDFHGIPLMPTYHPSYLLHNLGNSSYFWEVWDDMTQVLRFLKLPVPEKSKKR